jgi:hypothetical protein
MGARERIETLTNAWYGLALFGALMSVLMNGIGIFSLFIAGISLVVSCAITWFLGQRLLARSRFTRGLLVVLSALSGLLGLLGSARLVMAIPSGLSLSLLETLALSVASTWMNARSFFTLTSDSVKSYCRT